ncbi:MAG TPA: hypothetical protein VGR91_05070 [Stellaceae bacterium]|nr:hypothetical protein [Stellaceae bacterium]
MPSPYAEFKSDERIVARFLDSYHKIWQANFPGLNKRAHWHVIFAARTSPSEGVSCRSIHRTLYGTYGTDIRTCIERIKDCESDGFVRIVDPSNQPCAGSPSCLVAPTEKLRAHFDAHCAATIAEVCAVFGGKERAGVSGSPSTIAAIYAFFGSYDRHWRETSELVARWRGLTPAYLNDAVDHLITYQYWAIVMLLWSRSEFGCDDPPPHALVVDEINSRMWEMLRLGHLAIRERVGNLIRWGFFAEETIKKHKAVSLTPVAGAAIAKGLANTKPLLAELHRKLVAEHAELVAL